MFGSFRDAAVLARTHTDQTAEVLVEGGQVLEADGKRDFSDGPYRPEQGLLSAADAKPRHDLTGRSLHVLAKQRVKRTRAEARRDHQRRDAAVRAWIALELSDYLFNDATVRINATIEILWPTTLTGPKARRPSLLGVGEKNSIAGLWFSGATRRQAVHARRQHRRDEQAISPSVGSVHSLEHLIAAEVHERILAQGALVRLPLCSNGI
jgi:hypothetical protein